MKLLVTAAAHGSQWDLERPAARTSYESAWVLPAGMAKKGVTQLNLLPPAGRARWIHYDFAEPAMAALRGECS